jgi:hypothetical protein
MQIGKCHGVRHTVSAGDVAAGVVQFNTDFSAPLGAIVVVRTAAGALVAWDGAIVIGNSGRVNVDNTGATDFAATDTLDVIWF